MGVANVIALLSGVALFLFGMSLMGDGLKKVAGSKLELILYKLSSTPVKGVLLGTGVTAAIQSSSATSVMVVGFVNSGMMKIRQAIGIILGAILGTSVTGWIISLSALQGGNGWVSLLSTATISGIISVIGIILRMISKSQTHFHLSNILLGFAVLMTGMGAMSTAVEPLRESQAFIQVLTTFTHPIIGVLVGLVFTAVLQSASATVGILQALSITGVIDFEMAFPVIMGIAVGAALPVLLSALGSGINAKRTALVYLLADVLGTVICGVVFYSANAAAGGFSFLQTPMNTVGIAALNTAFRLVTVAVLTPCIGLMEALVVRLLPDRDPHGPEEQDFARMEVRFIEHPALAIQQSREAAGNMAMEARANLEDACYLIENYSDKGFRFVEQRENVVDRYEDKLGTYLIKITGRDLTADQNRDVTKFLHTISDLERISDHAMNIAECAQEISQKRLALSPSALAELRIISAAVREITHNAVTAFLTDDLDLAGQVEPLEEVVDNICNEMRLRHVNRLKSGECKLDQGFVFNDLLTNYERVADHCSNIALAIIELAEDAFDTHQYLLSLKEHRTLEFDRLFENYSQKFVLPEV